MHGEASRYLGPLVRVDDLPGLPLLKPVSSSRLVVPPDKLSTLLIGNRAFGGCCSSYMEWTANNVISADSLLTYSSATVTTSYRRGTARRLKSVEILSAAAQLYEKSHLTRRIAVSCGIKYRR